MYLVSKSTVRCSTAENIWLISQVFSAVEQERHQEIVENLISDMNPRNAL